MKPPIEFRRKKSGAPVRAAGKAKPAPVVAPSRGTLPKKPFDRTAYQREYMRKLRAAKP